MSAIGGYFGLELGVKNTLPAEAVLLNTGRNSLEYILRAKRYKRIHMPYYTCGVLRQPVARLGLEIKNYHINELLEPEIDFSEVLEDEAFLYTNYFGLKDEFIKVISQQGRNVIIDNAQSFYSPPIGGTDTFYSPRKFFGLPDGAYLFTDVKLDENLPVDVSSGRMSHLLKRVDTGAESGYSDFQFNEKDLDNQEIKRMSALTQHLIGALESGNAKKRREQNFSKLHGKLNAINKLNSKLLVRGGTFCYPLLVPDGKQLKKRLIERKIFIPTFWSEVLQDVSERSIEWNLVNNLVCVPIDQRYNENDMGIILKAIEDSGR